MEKKKLSPEQKKARKMIRIGHYPYMVQAMATAYQTCHVWRYTKDKTPCSVLDIFEVAKHYDEENPRQEGDPSFFYVSLEGAIGFCPSGLEYEIGWLFIPMEPGEERDAIEAKVKETLAAAQKAEAELAEAQIATIPHMYFCPECGAKLEIPDAKFCGNCGHKLD